MATTPASPLPSSGFDAALWLAEWSGHGGIYILAGDHLLLRRCSPLSPSESEHLDRLRDAMMLSGGGPAIAEHLLQLREGAITR